MKLLVIEDEVKLAECLNECLTETGYVVDLAHDGIDGLHLAGVLLASAVSWWQPSHDRPMLTVGLIAGGRRHHFRRAARHHSHLREDRDMDPVGTWRDGGCLCGNRRRRRVDMPGIRCRCSVSGLGELATRRHRCIVPPRRLKALITHGLESKTMKQTRACGALVALALSGAA